MNNSHPIRWIFRAAGGLALTLTGFAQPAAPAARLGSTVFHYEQLAAKPTGVGERRDVTDGPTATFERF